MTDLRDVVKALPADPFMAPGPTETVDDVFATTPRPERPPTAIEQREAEVRRRVAAGYIRRESKEGSP
jgi:hypothetical protein